ncbi:MAG: [protein-PII] uridylyltransferase [Fibrobacteres bacterium]|nr:[protein-PII] uridylyltransferase [Fibrobacterota bacterium]
MNNLSTRFRQVFFRIQNPSDRLAALRALLEEERALIRASFESGESAVASSARASDLLDALLRTQLESRMNATRKAWEIALVAVGGYGRREICPKSDVDLLILVPKKPSSEVISEVEQMLYPLWDLGLVVGHAVRSIPDCRKAAESDVETYTAFLQERFLGGNFALYREFADFVSERPSGRRQKLLVSRKLEEREKRLASQGQLAQMLEPNLKEGRGCLRDLHSLVWLAGILHGVRGLEDLARAGIVAPEELEELRHANEFLLRARIALHNVTGLKGDRLGFEEQPRVASALGYKDEGSAKAVELFQKNFYRHVRTVDSVTTRYCDLQEEQRRKVRPRSPDARFAVVDCALEVPVDGANPFLGNLAMVLDLHRAAQVADVGVGARTRWFVRQAVSVTDPSEIDRSLCLAKFLDIAKASSAKGTTIRELHRIGVLDLIVPDFRWIDCHSQHDIYHVYTTDEHTLTMLTRISTLSSSKDPVLAHLREELAAVEDVDVLFISALFHDVGKGLGPDHSESGAKLVREYCLHSGLSEARAAQASLLVKHHLLLNHLAQRRDIEDPKTLRDLLAKIPDEHLLRSLYVLTWADVSSVHPDAWSAWKASLLRKLYETAMSELLEEPTHSDSDSRREALAQETFGHPREEVLEHIKLLPRRYASSVSPRQVADHLELVQSLSSRHRIAVKARDMGSHWDLAVVMADRPGLLSRICAGLTTLGLSIASSQVYTRVDGLAIDLFSVIASDPSQVRGGEDLAIACEERIGKARDLPFEELDEMVRGYIRRWEGAVSRIMIPKVSVEFHDQASDDRTVLDITAPDRLGLLFDLTAHLSRRQWVIHSARVWTEADRAIDSFYLTGSDGRRIAADSIREHARQELAALLAPKK